MHNEIDPNIANNSINPAKIKYNIYILYSRQNPANSEVESKPETNKSAKLSVKDFCISKKLFSTSVIGFSDIYVEFTKSKSIGLKSWTACSESQSDKRTSLIKVWKDGTVSL